MHVYRSFLFISKQIQQQIHFQLLLITQLYDSNQSMNVNL